MIFVDSLIANSWVQLTVITERFKGMFLNPLCVFLTLKRREIIKWETEFHGLCACV